MSELKKILKIKTIENKIDALLDQYKSFTEKDIEHIAGSTGENINITRNSINYAIAELTLNRNRIENLSKEDFETMNLYNKFLNEWRSSLK